MKLKETKTTHINCDCCSKEKSKYTLIFNDSYDKLFLCSGCLDRLYAELIRLKVKR